MVLGLRSKNRKGKSLQVDYLIHVQEIKPWPPSQSLKSIESLLLHWENGDQNFGSFTSNAIDGEVEFNESFRLTVTLHKESSKKATSRDSFQKNFLDFGFYEPRKDKSMKAQVLGSAAINLADYGVIKESITISCPINFKKSSKSMSQPVLYVNIQPFDRKSLEKSGSESVSEVANENDDENEIASFTDDDVDDNFSSHSSRTASSFALESARGSPGQDEKNLPVSTNNEINRVNGDNDLPSTIPSSNLNFNSTKETLRNSNKSTASTSSTELTSEVQNPENSHEPKNVASIDYGQLNNDPDRESNKEEKNTGNREEFILEEKQPLEEEEILDNFPPKAVERQVKLRSNTLASNRTANGGQGNTRRDKLKQLKSVQLQYNVAENEEPISNIQIEKKAKKINVSENGSKSGSSNALNGRQKSANSQSESQIQLKLEVEKEKKPVSGSKVVSDKKVEMLEEELMEAAVVEVGLYSVVAEHGSSANKVHAPARRLSRFYLHVSKGNSPVKSASAARAIVSGLVLVSKACGNDVPRLTFWLSNSIVLRAIVSQVVENFQFVKEITAQKGRHKTDKTGNSSSDEWEEPQTFIMALERVEAWIFSRIVESIWWLTLTPHMQSTAVKGTNFKKIHSRKLGLGDQEQGNFAIELWKKAFKDACERLCPNRACGHECGCLPVISRLVMEQLVHRLDVAMFNAILRESADEMPTDPVSDPISDPKVLPILAGKSSFGAGAQLKNAVGSWSRWLTDLFGIDDEEPENNTLEPENSFKPFHLLHSLSDLMMLPFDMLADRSMRKEVCPAFGVQIIERVLWSFVPDEFNPDPIPDAVFESLDSEEIPEEDKKKTITGIPFTASGTIYSPPSTTSLTNIIGEVKSESLQRSGSTLLRKAYTSDDELDELDSPMSSIIIENSRVSHNSLASNWVPKGNGGRKVVRYELLRKVWKDE